MQTCKEYPKLLKHIISGYFFLIHSDFAFQSPALSLFSIKRLTAISITAEKRASSLLTGNKVQEA